MSLPGGGLPELDPVIHAQARLRVVTALSTIPEGDQISFPRLRDILGMTGGNLSVHLGKLEDAGYVEIAKTHKGRTPVTYLALTRRGRLAFDDYTTAIRALLDAAGPGPAGGPPTGNGSSEMGQST
ncbi:transcriptional regulator [Sphaerisporangium sp. TRM90804]|uniref:transcriptional regulator n=1 Tax=Sphaerisporangium sp. TRM90804 TaxID=3031113 RepID=UPI00244CCECD|nr:transcriptional regulator [Sphaerisporangium sp. TRM90804]MDH2429583.1 transcriptional regulator [Sphaerisporangium sp. TRM90804]